jgi:hypothetical protein
LRPAHPREPPLQLDAEAFARRRERLLDEECQAFATAGCEPRPELRQILIESFAIARFDDDLLLVMLLARTDVIRAAPVTRWLLLALHSFDEACGTRWIVEIENGSLRESIGGAATRGMERLPSILIGRPSTVLTTSGNAPVRRGIAVA